MKNRRKLAVLCSSIILFVLQTKGQDNSYQYMPANSSSTQQELDENKEYRAWKQKQEIESKALELDPLTHQADLLSAVYYYLGELSEYPDSFYDQQEALFNYNYLREMLHLPLASSWQDIDDDWLQKEDYRIWKDELNEDWQAGGKKPIAQQAALLHFAHYYLEELEKTQDESYKIDALFNYNYLREMLHLPLALAVQNIDKSWLDQQLKDYDMWRETKQVEWDTDILLPEKLADLGDEATRAISEPDLASNPNRALFPYNFLRELLSLPLAQSLDEIDTLWLSQILPEVEFFAMVEQYDWQPPTEAQKELVLEGARLLKLKGVVAAGYSHERGGQSTAVGPTGYVALCQTPDVDTRLFTLYHELGHIAHHDAEASDSITSGEQDPAELIKAPNFKADLDNIKKYFATGLSSIPSLSNTKAGKELAKALSNTEAQEALKQYGTLWIPPEDPQLKNFMMWGRGSEQRADLFSLRTLLKLKNISSVLTTIEHYALHKGNKSYLVTQGTADLHPSHVERAIYMIGFLADRYDVRRELDEWEKHGVCLSGEQATSYAKLFTPAWNTSQATALEKAYRKQKLEKRIKKYSDDVQAAPNIY